MYFLPHLQSGKRGKMRVREKNRERKNKERERERERERENLKQGGHEAKG